MDFRQSLTLARFVVSSFVFLGAVNAGAKNGPGAIGVVSAADVQKVSIDIQKVTEQVNGAMGGLKQEIEQARSAYVAAMKKLNSLSSMAKDTMEKKAATLASEYKAKEDSVRQRQEELQRQFNAAQLSFQQSFNDVVRGVAKSMSLSVVLYKDVVVAFDTALGVVDITNEVIAQMAVQNAQKKGKGDKQEKGQSAQVPGAKGSQ
jgi:Skp family chaperone for outer membrane proteins